MQVFITNTTVRCAIKNTIYVVILARFNGLLVFGDMIENVQKKMEIEPKLKIRIKMVHLAFDNFNVRPICFSMILYMKNNAQSSIKGSQHKIEIKLRDTVINL